MAEVTLKDIYEIVNRLEDKMDDNLNEMRSQIKDTNNKLNDIEDKVSNMKGWTAGVASAVSVFVGIVDITINAWMHR